VDEATGPAEVFQVAIVHPHAPGGVGDADQEPRHLGANEVPGCLLPRAAAYDPAGDWLVVGCEGSGQVISLQMRDGGPLVRINQWDVGPEPTGVAVDPERRAVFAWSQRGHTLTSFPIDAYHASASDPDEGLVRTVAVGPQVDASDPIARGRALFHATGDARISADGRACASCHPDGRDDGLVWSTPDGPRQTPTLAGRLAGTAPYGWNGTRSTVKKHVTGTLHRLGGTGLDDESMDALVAYCMHMPEAPRATQAALKDDPLVAEGRDLFDSPRTECSSCHIADGTFTDGNRHDVRSKGASDPRRRFDTPSLRFVSGTAPYFHDGRYPTLRALLAGSNGTMGHTTGLSPHEIDALEAYLDTL
jgi:mono/diheme cytochrome c family protein